MGDILSKLRRDPDLVPVSQSKIIVNNGYILSTYVFIIAIFLLFCLIFITPRSVIEDLFFGRQNDAYICLLGIY